MTSKKSTIPVLIISSNLSFLTPPESLKSSVIIVRGAATIAHISAILLVLIMLPNRC